jgi:hypothetical protein
MKQIYLFLHTYVKVFKSISFLKLVLFPSSGEWMKQGILLCWTLRLRWSQTLDAQIGTGYFPSTSVCVLLCVL